MTDQGKYKVVRFFQGSGHIHRKRTIRKGLTLDEAQAHCGDPETNSKTCTRAVGKARTRKYGPWFDGYTHDR